MTTTSEQIPIILCCGENGRAVVYGYVDAEPVPGEPVVLHRARMVIRWDVRCGGLFGLASRGPRGDTRITHAVERTCEIIWQEWLAVSPEAATAIDGWAPWEG